MSMQNSNARRRRPRRRGFTLAELLVVLGIIMLSITLLMPMLRGLFVASGDLEAIAAMGGMLSTARGLAIESQTYALLHIQPGVDNKGWVAPMRYNLDTANPRFTTVEGFPPQQVPAGYAFGDVDHFVSGGTFAASVNTEPGRLDFLTFNVIFAADGSLVSEVNGGPPVIDTSALVFTGGGKVKIWNASATTLNEEGVRVMTPVSYMRFTLLGDQRASLLNAEKRFLVINPYTGQLLQE